MEQANLENPKNITSQRLKSKMLLTVANQTLCDLLRDSFLEKQKRNASYSLRSFSQFLKVDQSFLSKVLKGQKRFSLDMIETLAIRVGLAPDEARKLVAEGVNSGFNLIEDEKFRLIADWSHFAILELVKIRSTQADPKLIAKRLGLHIEEVRTALARLERFGFIAIEDKKIKLLSPNNDWSNVKHTSEAKKNLQRQFLQKSLEALDEIDFSERDHGSVTIAVAYSQMPQFKKRLAELREQLAEEFQLNNKFDEVYQLTISFYPITKKRGSL